MVVNRRSDDFLWHEIEEALDALVAVENATGGAQAQHELLIARGAETGLEKRTFSACLRTGKCLFFQMRSPLLSFRWRDGPHDAAEGGDCLIRRGTIFDLHLTRLLLALQTAERR
jgi:hypothetical protein